MSKNGSNGASSVSSTVRLSGALDALIRLNTLRARGASSMWKFMMLNSTSSAVMGMPSCQTTLS